MSDVDTLTDRLVTANRILTNEGILDGFGHVTVRHPDHDDRMLVSRYQSSILVEADDIIQMRLDGEILDDRDVDTYSETAIHRAVYRHRDDVDGVVHHHAPEVMPFAITGEPIEAAYHLGAIFADGVPLFDDYNHEKRGKMVIGEAEGDRMAENLGDARAQLLQGHGANTVGRSLKEAVVATIHLVKNAKYQRTAGQVGDPEFYEDEDSIAAVRDGVVLAPRTVDRAWNHLVAKVEESD
jgi:HCOMODA/2-hydroxy-3-carboxy-muconic semialdehyde decarboxylase